MTQEARLNNGAGLEARTVYEAAARRLNSLLGTDVAIDGWHGWAVETKGGVLVFLPGVSLKGGAFEAECVRERSERP